MDGLHYLMLVGIGTLGAYAWLANVGYTKLLDHNMRMAEEYDRTLAEFRQYREDVVNSLERNETS